MGLDIRIPIGLMFGIIGLVMVVSGVGLIYLALKP